MPMIWRCKAIDLRLPLLMVGFLALAMAAPSASAQNLVPNPGFEDKSHCPTHYYDLSCTPWRPYTSASPDYFNRCQPLPTVGIPDNFFGHQETDGAGYAGFYSITVPGTYEYKEYLTTWIEPMQPGFEYQVSMKVSLADSSSKGTDDIGILFYQQGPHYIPAHETYLSRRPQINFRHYGPLTDRDKWYVLDARFTPDSVYNNIVIGGFGGASTVPPIQQVDLGTGHLNGAYYYLDSVVVRLVHEASLNVQKTQYCEGDTFKFNFQVVGDFRAGNWFYLELSDSDGQFHQPIVLDSIQTRWDGVFEGRMPMGLTSSADYRLRLRSSYPVNRFDPHPHPITYIGRPAFQLSSNSPVCEGETLVLHSGLKDSVGDWTWVGPQGQASGLGWTIPSAKPGHSGWYRIETSICGYEDSILVSVKTNPSIELAETVITLCPGDSLKISAQTHPSSAKTVWSIGSQQWSMNPLAIAGPTQDSSLVSVWAESEGGCRSDTLDFRLFRKSVSAKIHPLSILRLGDTARLHASVSPTTAHHHWTGPEGFESRLAEPFRAGMTKAKEGWYHLRASVGACQALDSIYVMVSTLSEVEIHPNPSGGWIQVQGRLNQSGLFPFVLMDMQGRVVQHGQFSIDAYRFRFDLNLGSLGIGSGVYFLHLKVPEDPQVKRVVFVN